MKKKIVMALVCLSIVFPQSVIYAEEVVVGAEVPVVVDTPIPVVAEAQAPEEVLTDPTPTPEPIPTETVLIRNGDTVLYSGTIDLPAEGMIDITDNAGVSHSVNTRSVLGVLYALDQSQDSFSLSNLQYYTSFSSFYLKCMTPSGGSELCDNWQYVVGGVSPWTSVDATILTGGETLGFYFGSPYRATLSTTTLSVNDTMTVKTEKYNYVDNTWGPRIAVSVGITTSNPDDQWNPIVVSTTPVDEEGGTVLTFPHTGSYSVGVAEDYYFPSYLVTVTDPTPIGGGGGGGSSAPVISFSTQQAFSFLLNAQHADGSWGDMLYTDWAAIALAQGGNTTFETKIKVAEFLKNNPLSSSTVTDNERHAMALMSLGINPYTGTSVNYISKITASFDGTQIGSSSLYNDDIFALIVLKNAGYTSSDALITTDIAYLLSQQSPDGSWGGIDLTAAAILALRNFTDVSGVSDALTRAENYLIGMQGSDGSFGNSFATSWTLQALSGNASLATYTSRADTFLASVQQTDGGVDLVSESVDNRIWATSYALPAVLHSSWNTSMQSFVKFIEQSTDSSPTTQVVPPVTTPFVTPTPNVITAPVVEKLDNIPLKVVPKKRVKNITKPNVVEAKVLTPLEQESALGASVASSQEGHGLPYRVIHRITRAIAMPFVWLWLHLGF